mgnify:CR=1 FL=1
MGNKWNTIFARIMADVKEYGIAAAAFLVYAVIVNLIFHAFCPLVIFCGFPCPGCGISRAAVCFAAGRWKMAWQWNPVIFPIVLFAAYFFLNRYLLGRSVKGAKVMAGIILAMLVVVYIVRMYLYFPDRAPCVYTEHNVLAQIFPFYQQILHECGIL